MRPIRCEKHGRCCRVIYTGDVAGCVLQHERKRLRIVSQFCNSERHNCHDLISRGNALERFDFKACKLAQNRNRLFRVEQVVSEYFGERSGRQKRIHRHKYRHTFSTAAAPGIRAIPVAALEQLEQIRTFREQFTDLYFV